MKWIDSTQAYITIELTKNRQGRRIKTTCEALNDTDKQSFEIVDITEKATFRGPTDLTGGSFEFFSIPELKNKLDAQGFSDYTVKQISDVFTPNVLNPTASANTGILTVNDVTTGNIETKANTTPLQVDPGLIT